MEELNDLLRGATPAMKGRIGSPPSTAAAQPSTSDSGERLTIQRPAPDALAARAEDAGPPEAVTCPVCGGVGFVREDLPLGHPDFGKAVPCQCKLNERRSRRRSRFQGVSDIEGLARFTFESFETAPAGLPPHKCSSLQGAYDAALAFADQPQGWLLFRGDYGCGKTHLAAAIFNRRLERDQAAIFVVIPDLLDHLRMTFDPSSETSYDELFNEVRNASLLLLDDLGVQSGTPWAQEKLFQILNHRYNGQLPTVLTTNQRMDDLDQRLRSRLQDLNLVANFRITAPDYRAGANPGQGGLSTLSHHADQRFDNFEVRRRNTTAEAQAGLRQALSAAEDFANDPNGWFVLMGPNGVGKTHLAAAISNAQQALGQLDVIFVVVPALLDYLRAAFNPQSSVPYDRRFDEFKDAPLLVLDDLGTESATPWAKEKLFQLLNDRHSRKMPTIITTSVAQDKLEPWLLTRIMDTARCQVWNLKASSYRGSADQEEGLRARRAGKDTRGKRSW